MSELRAPAARQHISPLRMAVGTWLLLISAIAGINFVNLAKLDQDRDGTLDAQIALLEERLLALSQQIEQKDRQPAGLSVVRYETEHQALDQRLDQIEQALDECIATEALDLLQNRIEQLEARRAAERQTAPTARRPRPPVQAAPVVLEPPFLVIGTELRAGERFVSVLPAGIDALSEVRLLRPGESTDGWRFDVIDGSTAVFQHGDVVRRLAIPAR